MSSIKQVFVYPGRKQASSMHILVINPNSSSKMTDTMSLSLSQMSLPDWLTVSTYTALPAAPASINNGEDVITSKYALEGDTNLMKRIQSGTYDAILIACFSDLRHFDLQFPANPTITSIFDASILTALSFSRTFDIDDETLNTHQWGIVTTGSYWETDLAQGTRSFLGQDESARNSRFAGVFSSGLDAGELHSLPAEAVREALRDATRRLMQSSHVTCVVMGCAGMTGLEDIIRSVAFDMYGTESAKKLYVVDAVRAGVMQLEHTLRSMREFSM